MFFLGKRAEKLAKSIESDINPSDYDDLIAAYKSIQDSFAPHKVAPVDRIITNASLRARENAQGITLLNRIKIVKVLAAGTSIAAAAFGVLLLSQSKETYPEFKMTNKASTPFEIQIVKKALAAIETPDKIIYYKTIFFTGLDKPIKGDLQELMNANYGESETWVYPKIKMLKRYSSSAFSEEAIGRTEHMTVIKDGKQTDVSKTPYGNSVYEAPAEQGYDEDSLSRLKSFYQKALQSGKVKIVGEEEINGEDTYRIRMLSKGSQNTLENIASWEELKKAKFEFAPGKEVYVRKVDYRPVVIMETYFDIKTFEPSLSSKEHGEPSITIFTDFKEIEPDDFNMNIFTVEWPEDGTYDLSKRYSTIAELKQFKGFEIYYLGEKWNGYKLSLDWTEHSKSAGYPKGDIKLSEDKTYLDGPSNSLGNLDYRKSNKEKFSMFITPSDAPVLKSSKWAAVKNTKLSPITIDGKAATLKEIRRKGGLIIYQVMIELGNSLVIINANYDKELAIEAAKDLRKLN